MTALDAWLPSLSCPRCGSATYLRWRSHPGAPLSSWSVPNAPTRTEANRWPWVVCTKFDWAQPADTSAGVAK